MGGGGILSPPALKKMIPKFFARGGFFRCVFVVHKKDVSEIYNNDFLVKLINKFPSSSEPREMFHYFHECYVLEF